MNANTPPIDFTTGVLIFIALVVLVGFIRFVMFLFGGPDPLVWNTVARVEAGQNPANLLNTWQARQNQRRLGCVMSLFVIAFVFVFFAPGESGEILRALVDAVMKVGAILRDNLMLLAQEFSSE